MKALVIGCGRVGSNVALQLAEEGWDVTAVDEKEEALSRLGENWSGGFVLGHGMDVDTLREAGIGTRPTFSGTRYGRRFSGWLKRSLITASWAAVNASRTPKL